jgi:hypothetical protein
MSFKEQIEADIDSVFFVTDEFAKNVIIDGKSVPMILDNDTLNEKADVYAMGLSEGEQLIFVKEKDLLRLPQSGEQITIEGERWYIRNAVPDMGVCEIRIGRNLN